MEWTYITIKLLQFVRDLGHEKSHFSGDKYPFKSATIDGIYIYIKTTWENVKFQILLEYTQIQKENLKRTDFFFDEQAVVYILSCTSILSNISISRNSLARRRKSFRHVI